MKKIVALVLCLALVLALGTVAFATATDYVSGKAYILDADKKVAVDATATDVTFKAADADNNKIAHYVIGNETYVVTDKASSAAYAVRSGNSWLYLKAADVEYKAEGELVGKTVKAEDATCKTFYQENAQATKGKDVASYVEDDDTVYVVVKAGEPSAIGYLLIGGKMYGILGDAEHAPHAWVYGFAEDKVTVTGRTCPDCGKTQKVVSYNEYVLLSNSKRATDGSYYFEIVASGAATPASGVTSAKTFDAGVAMYAGLALMSVAGSAVVIGKKKEF